MHRSTKYWDANAKFFVDGNANIRIDGKDDSLKDALLENKITMEEIIAKANLSKISKTRNLDDLDRAGALQETKIEI